jgi:hypothetical protein
LSSRPLGISLSNVSERGLELTKLTQVDLSRVNAGIDAGSHAQGKCTLDRLAYDSQADAWLKQQKAQPTPKANQNAQPTPTPKPTVTPKATKSAEDVHTSALVSPLASAHPFAEAAQAPSSPSASSVPSPTPLPASCK